MFLSCLEIQILLRQGPLFQLALTEKEFLLRNFFSLQRHVSYVTHLNTLHQTLFETPRGRLSNPRSWNALQILVVLENASDPALSGSEGETEAERQLPV